MSDIKVSVCCITYNQVKYIRQCLDSLVAQITSFDYEIIINDDASDDGTTAIIQEYEHKYPELIRPIYHDRNEYSQGLRINYKNTYPLVRGEYVALCEGDDYWTDPYKLQKQFELMERHLECSACFHMVDIVTEDDRKLHSHIPRKRMKSLLRTNDYFKSYFEFNVFFQTSSYFFRSQYALQLSDMYRHGQLPQFINISQVGDVVLLLYLKLNGDFLFINSALSHYRRTSNNSWTKRCFQKKDYAIRHLKNQMEMVRAFDQYTNFNYHSYILKKLAYFEYSTILINEDYEQLQLPKYREFLKREPGVKRLKINLKMKCPKLAEYYRKIRKRHD